MAVYTQLSEVEIIKLLENYKLGFLVNFIGIKMVLRIILTI